MRNQKELYPPKVELADVGSWSEDEIQRAKNLWEREIRRSMPYQMILRKKRDKKSGLE